MKMTIERTQYEPKYIEGIIYSWDIAFSIETDEGQQLYTPITIYRRDINSPATEAVVCARALQQVLPGQLLHLYEALNIPDELDEIEAEIHQEHMKLVEEQEYAKKLKEEKEARIADARQRLEIKRAERLALAQEQAATFGSRKKNDESTNHSH